MLYHSNGGKENFLMNKEKLRERDLNLRPPD